MQTLQIRHANSAPTVVGYSTIEIPQGYSIFTPVFKNVDQTSFKLSQITVCNQAGEEFDNVYKFLDEEWNAQHVCGGAVAVRKLKDGAFIAALAVQYTSEGYNADPALRPATWGWGTSGKTMEFAAGEGIIVSNVQGVPVKFRVSGEVELVPVENIPMGYSIFGNNTPVDITLGDIMVCNQAGEEFDNVYKFLDEEWNAQHVCGGAVAVRKLKDGAFVADIAAQYTSEGWNADPSLRPATWGWGANKGMVIKSGEAVVVSNVQGVPVIFKLKGPLDK